MPIGSFTLKSIAMKTPAASLLTAVTLFCAFAHAQEYSFRSFVAADGLNNLSVQKIYQDRTGFIWASTENGLFRYDGTRFQAFGPEEAIPPVAGVAFGEAPDGTMLVGAAIGLYQFAGNRFQQIPAPFKSVSWTQGIQSDNHGHSYIAADSGLFVMESNPAKKAYAFHRIYPAAQASAEIVYSVFIDGDTIWFGCDLKLCALQSGQVTVFDEKSGLPGVPLATVLKDRDGNLWVRARNAGILERPAGSTKFNWPDTPVPGKALTGTPALDRSGRVLLGTPDGLLIQNEKGWQLIDRHDGMRGGVFAAFEDRQHSLWMGTGGRGLTTWRGYHEWESYSSASGLPSDNVYEMLPQADGSVWVGTEAGLVRGEPHPFSIAWRMLPKTSGTAVHSLQMTPAGDLWIGTASRGIGLVHVRTGDVEWFGEKQGLTGKLALTIRFDRQHQLWAATEAGLFVARPPYLQFSRVPELPASWFWTVVEGADGTIWAGGADGLFAFTAGHWQHWDHSSGLTNQSVVSLGPDPDGSVWVGYHHGGGIDRVHLVKPGAPSHGVVSGGAAIEKGVQRPGSEGLIYFLDYDRSGHLWAGTERGVDKWDGSHWSHYDTTDGLVWDDCDLGGFASSPDGALWFGTSGGLSRFTPHIEKSSSSPPEVVFTNLRMGSANIRLPTHPRTAASHFAIALRAVVLPGQKPARLNSILRGSPPAATTSRFKSATTSVSGVPREPSLNSPSSPPGIVARGSSGS